MRVPQQKVCGSSVSRPHHKTTPKPSYATSTKVPRTPMDPRLIKLLAATIMFSYWLAGAQAVGEPTEARPVESKADARATTPHAHSKKEAKPESAPCPRGTWKDDPVCFGEGEKDGLPLPSASSIQHSNPPKELTVNPTANLNPRPNSPGPYQAGVVYQPNGNAVTSSYGGGVSVQLPF